jgi:hypothetical protein
VLIERAHLLDRAIQLGHGALGARHEHLGHALVVLLVECRHYCSAADL